MISSHWDSRVSALRNLRRYCLASSKLMEKVQKGLFFVLLALFNSSLCCYHRSECRRQIEQNTTFFKKNTTFETEALFTTIHRLAHNNKRSLYPA